MMPYFIIILALFLAVACESVSDDAQPPAITIANTDLISKNQLSWKEDSLPSKIVQESQQYAAQGELMYTKNPAFKIQLRPTAKVRALLDAGKETLIVSVVLYGIPTTPDALKKESYYDPEEELIYLLDKEYKLSSNQQELLIEEAIPTEALQALKEKNYTVVVDAYSGRKSSENNLFHTKVLTGTIEEFEGTSQVLAISLL